MPDCCFIRADRPSLYSDVTSSLPGKDRRRLVQAQAVESRYDTRCIQVNCSWGLPSIQCAESFSCRIVGNQSARCTSRLVQVPNLPQASSLPQRLCLDLKPQRHRPLRVSPGVQYCTHAPDLTFSNQADPMSFLGDSPDGRRHLAL